MKRSPWHEQLKGQILNIGRELGFHSKEEVIIKEGRGKIDCVWYIDKPILEYFIAFEIETSTSGPQIVENLVKILSVPSQIRPRFLIQIYKDRFKEERIREHINRIANSLPVAAHIIENVGDNIDNAISKILIDSFNWICQYVTLSDELINRLKAVLPNRVLNIFHYGEPTFSHLRYLDNAIKNCEDKIIHIKSIPKLDNGIPIEFKELYKFDIVIISDISPKYVDLKAIKNYIEKNVIKNGTMLIITGGHGLTKGYNILKDYLGIIIESREDKQKEYTMNLDGINISGYLTFGGFNKVKVIDPDVEVISNWSFENYPALIRRKIGKGEIIVFTSDCSPTWGTPSIKGMEFNKMWRKLVLERDFNVK